MKTDQQSSAAETTATFEMNQISPLLQLSETQKDQVGTALYQVQLDTQDPAWIKNNVPNSSGNPLAVLDAQAKAKEDALAKILTPDQLATYHQQAQSSARYAKSDDAKVHAVVGDDRSRCRSGPGYAIVPGSMTTGYTSANTLTTTTNYVAVPSGDSTLGTTSSTMTNSASATNASSATSTDAASATTNAVPAQ